MTKFLAKPFQSVLGNKQFLASTQLTFFENRPFGDAFVDICTVLGCDLDSPAWPDLFGRQLSQLFADENKINALSLFSGAGGLDVGFHDAGFNIVESVEIERKFCDTLEKNTGAGEYFTGGKVNCIDIRDYKSKNLPLIDFIIGGPPCQTFSAAGRRANGVLGTTDERGVLFREYVRLLKELRPCGFLFENVYGITGAQNGEAWQEILQEFSSAGYTLHYRILDAADYGVPQHRERLIIVGLRDKSFAFPRPTHGPDSLDGAGYYYAQQAIASAPLAEHEKETGLNGRYGHLLNAIPPGLNYSFYTEEMGHPQPVFAWRSKFSDFLYKADPLTPVRTIKAQGGQYTGPFHWDNRKFSVSEYKRLQTFPDAYAIVGNRQTQIHQIGNSVPPQLARILAMAIRAQIFDTAFPFRMSWLDADEQLGFRQRKRQLTASYKSKAAAAIKQKVASDGDTKTPLSRSYHASLADSNFAFVETGANHADFAITADWGDDLQIIVQKPCGQSLAKTLAFTLTIYPVAGQWGLPVRSIVAECSCEGFPAYTATWKAIEVELIRNGIKADLVQLCGYYQYAPKLRCALDCATDAPISFLKPIVEGGLARRMLFESELADAWHVPLDVVPDYAQRLRELGYEIRNTNTNPQIATGQWLIPYEFPTLTPLSVQLRKSLR